MSQPAMFQLTEADQQLLLQIARNSVRSYLLSESALLPDVPAGQLTEQHGIFVSIHKCSELRGCIGNVHPTGPLFRSAAECAIAAAVGDPRFVPLMLRELDEVEFEISVLSPLERVQNLAEIEVGRHGLLVTKKSARGLLLPQVARTFGWNRERFIEETCKKAGLRPDDWKDGTTIHCFSAFVFGERQFRLSATT
jgi:AmmeMemoRadiSam system protein A